MTCISSSEPPFPPSRDPRAERDGDGADPAVQSSSAATGGLWVRTLAIHHWPPRPLLINSFKLFEPLLDEPGLGPSLLARKTAKDLGSCWAGMDHQLANPRWCYPPGSADFAPLGDSLHSTRHATSAEKEPSFDLFVRLSRVGSQRTHASRSHKPGPQSPNPRFAFTMSRPPYFGTVGNGLFLFLAFPLPPRPSFPDSKLWG